jgi:methionyl-tRNA synthetase
MIIKYQGGLLNDIPPAEHDSERVSEALSNCQFDRALEAIWEQVRGLNQFIDEEKPWEIAKNGDEEHLREVLASQVSDLLEIADLIEPFLPQTAPKIRRVFSGDTVQPIEGTLFPKKESGA